MNPVAAVTRPVEQGNEHPVKMGSGKARDLYRLWLEDPYFDAQTQAELAATTDPEEIEDRFCKHLEFGTAGLRGIMAAGLNRMNRYTIRLATQALADRIASEGEEARSRGVVLAYDSRRQSADFAREAALVLCANGIRAHMWDDIRPTPMLSFAVRRVGAIAGVVITASHNPPEYNGYKVYWEDGGQASPELAAEIKRAMVSMQDITAVHPADVGAAVREGLLKAVPPEVDQAYIDILLAETVRGTRSRRTCSVLFTPLHGAGHVPVSRALRVGGFQVHVVASQAEPDPNFPTVRRPNPEEAEAFQVALESARELRPDVIMATDPDGDRLGVMVQRGDGGFQQLNGNELGVLLTEHILSQRSLAGALPSNGAVVKSIATSNLVASLCREYGVSLVETHVGFRFIGEKIREWETSREHSFLFGLEESCGYLASPVVRDKDGVMAALLAAGAVALQKAEGRTLYEALENIWRRHGYYLEDQHNVTLVGKDGQAKIEQVMGALRTIPPREFGGVEVRYTDDYLVGLRVDHESGETQRLDLERANVLHYRFADGGFVMVRPSGTEPKLKVYFSVVGGSRSEAERRLVTVRASALLQLGLTQ